MGLWECKYNYCWLNKISITQNVDLALTSEETNYVQLKRADILPAFFLLLNVMQTREKISVFRIT